MGSIYKGNLVDARLRRTRMLIKLKKLRQQINQNIPLNERIVIEKKIQKLRLDLDNLEKEMLKVQKGMQNSNKWMDGTYNSVDVQF
ncbi:MAG: hypothetical protein E7Z91_07310 [Cyanobacteria bacterium SIG30]|nr:hypothetical protein [Cyanobacteria bacterium SIG30]